MPWPQHQQTCYYQKQYHEGYVETSTRMAFSLPRRHDQAESSGLLRDNQEAHGHGNNQEAP